jgi:RNA polymerase-binding transcription factor DksA
MTVHQAQIAPDSGMTKARLRVLRAELEEQRRFRIEQLGELAVELAASTDHEHLHVARALAVAAEAALRDIDLALVRMERGGYGICEDCKRPIQQERLDVLPMSRLCTPCQRRASATTPALTAGGRR